MDIQFNGKSGENTPYKSNVARLDHLAGAGDASIALKTLQMLSLGVWIFEFDEGGLPRMYGNREMDLLLGCDGERTTPEEYYHAWYDHVHPDHYDEVNKAVDEMVMGKISEVQYPFLHPTRGEMWVRCGGRRDMEYAKGIRIFGHHRDVSQLIHVQKKIERENQKMRECIQLERERANTEHCLYEAFKVLVSEHDLHTAIDQLISTGCTILGAQWCAYGMFVKDHKYVMCNSYAAPGEELMYDLNESLVYEDAFLQDSTCHRGRDFLPMPDFRNHSIYASYVNLTPRKQIVAQVSSCYSHLVRRDGRPFGTLVIMYRDKHVMTPTEERFFAAAAYSIQLALIQQQYEDKLMEDRRLITLERDKAIAAERAKTLFFSSVSHDIRTPLNAILGFAELLEEGVENPEERQQYISTIRSSGKVLGRLVNDVLDLSKLEAGETEIIAGPTNVVSAVRKVTEAFEVTRNAKSIELEVRTAPMPLVILDEQRVMQVLFNLVSNAFKYTDRGSIRVTSDWRGDGTLTLSVADTGKGISAEDQKRIFSPFVQVVDRNHRDGTGLGLTICSRLAKLMGGELTVASELGKGTTFTMVLHGVKAIRPASARAKAEDSAAVPSDSASAVRFRRVLIVDDSSVNRMVLKAKVVRLGLADVTLAENGRQALDILRGNPSFDVVLTDFWMPEMDGCGLADALRADERLKGLPIYLVTADVDAVRDDIKGRFTGVILKPISQDDLRAVLC